MQAFDKILKLFVWIFALLLLSGVALMVCYVPVAVPSAAVSAKAMPAASSSLSAGALARGVHFWAAQIALLAALIVLANTFFVKTNRPHAGWAAAILVLTGLFWFTGMLLPWDQLAFWLASILRPPTGLFAIYWLHTLVLSVLLLAVLIACIRYLRSTHHETHP